MEASDYPDRSWKPEVKRDKNIWEFTRGYKVQEAGKHENADQFRALQYHLNCGGDRSYAATAEFMGMAEETMRSWAGKYNWERRAAAWDKQKLALAFKDANKVERSRQRQAIQEFRQANEDQAKMMMEVSADLVSIIQRRIAKAEAEDENIPMGLVSGLLRAAANISDSGRQSWATSLGVGQLMDVVDQELEEVKVEVLDDTEDEAYQIPLDE